MATCEECGRLKPPRTHHCWLCGVCISKRDHHCFFMATCIGLRNQQYFLIYCFYQFIAGFYFILIMALYLLKKFNYRINVARFVTLPLVTIFKAISEPDNVDVDFSICVGLMYGTLVAMLVGGCFFVWEIYLIATGLTNYEARTNSPPQIVEHKDLSQRISAVFPTGVVRQFILPFSYPLVDDSKSTHFATSTRKKGRKLKPH